MVEKLIRDGKVAVIYSPGYGAGWSTWAWGADDAEILLFDREIAEAVEQGNIDRVIEIASAKCPTQYMGGADQLQLDWVDQGTRFEIQEYDGYEKVRIIDRVDWWIA